MPTSLQAPVARLTAKNIQSSLGLSEGDEMFISVEINNFPRLTCNLAHGKKGGTNVVEMVNDDIVKTVQSFQKSAWAPRDGEEGDLTFELEDGLGGSIKFEGCTSGLSLTASTGSWDYQLEADGVVSKLLCLNTSIYAQDMQRFRDVLEIEGDSVALRCKELLQKMIENWKNTVFDGMSANSKAIVGKIHAVNERFALPAWYKILENSAETTKITGLDEYVKRNEHKSAMHAVNTAIYNAYISNGNFKDMMMELMGLFQLWMVPSVDGKSMQFHRILDLLTAEPTDLEVDASVISFGSQSPSGLPITHVAAIGQKSPEHRESTEGNPDTLDYASVNMYAAIYPETVYTGGRILEINNPPWIAPLVVNYPDESLISRWTLDEVASEEFSNKLNVIVGEASDEAEKTILKDWVRTAYLDASLATSSIGFSLPLGAMSNLKIGKRYRIKAKTADGAVEIGTAMLSRINYNLSVRGGGGSALTGLGFTHFQAAGFQLPD
jgi:hypothetical protein